MKRFLAFVFFAALGLSGISNAQTKLYFVDGFHGGVYGHYPMQTYTTFMSDLIDKYQDWSMCIEIEPETWDTVKVATPDAYRRFQKDIVTNERVEFTNPSYAQPYCYNIQGESLIRQFEYGIKKIHQHFPGVTFSTYAVEEPCFTSALPQILKGFGFKYASLKNPNTCWGGYAAAHGGELVNWIGPDGTSILTSPRHEIEDLTADDVWSTTANGNSAEYFKKALDAGFKHPVGMCYQDAGWTFGPWVGYGKDAKNGVNYITWRKYFEEIAADVVPEDYKFSQEDVCGALMWGSQVMQRIGRTVRSAENHITAAEKMGTIANIANGYIYSQPKVDDAWRTLLLSQHHDSWIVPYNGLKGKGTWADWICNTWTVNTENVARQVVAEAKRSFSEVQAGQDAFVRIYNTQAVSRKEVVSVELSEPAQTSVKVKDIDGNIVPSSLDYVDGAQKLSFVAEVPAFGFTTYSLEYGQDANAYNSEISASKVLENSMYRIEVDPKRGGVIKSIRLKTAGKKELVAKEDLAFGEMKGYFYDEGKFRSSADQAASVTLVENTPFEKSLRICGMIASHPFVETITIKEGDPMIYFNLDINWRHNVGIGAYRQKDAYNNPERGFYNEDYKLNMYFPAALQNPQLYKNAPFDVCKSELESTRFSNYHDIKHNIILNWVSLESADGNGFSIHSDHTTSYAYSPGKPLALTIQYSGDGLWGRNYLITEPTHLDFSVLPHNGGWEASEDADNAWNEPLVCSVEKNIDMAEASYINADGSGYELVAAHPDKDGILFRFYNSTGDASEKTITVDPSFVSAAEVDLCGNMIREIALNSKDGSKCFTLSMPLFGFRTIVLRKGASPADFVNPLIGASTSIGAAGVYHGLGKTFPGATTPFGMVQANPQTISGGDNAPGYSAEHTTIEGFSILQMSGVGWSGDFGNFLVMPTTGEMTTIAGLEDGSIKGWRSALDKKTENARAGYYSADLTDYGIKAEMTATTHGALMRFTFPKNDRSRIQIDLARRVSGTCDLEHIAIVDDHTFGGFIKCTPETGGWGNGLGGTDYTIYFYATTDKPLADYGFWNAEIPEGWSRKNDAQLSKEYLDAVKNAAIIRGSKELEGKQIGFFTEFPTEEGEQVTLKVGVSFVSIEGAYRNYMAELARTDFDTAAAMAFNNWDKALRKINVEGGSEADKTIFYTALYHTMIDPRTFSDVDGSYVGGDLKPHKGGRRFTKRTIFSGWDVFRSQFPLQTIINPRVVNDMINSLTTMAEESGRGYYERWECVNSYSGCMLGNPALSVIADAYVKGIRGFDAGKAYQYAVNTSAQFGNDKLGYTPGGNSISHTLEYAYTDWCVSRLAEALGKTDDAAVFRKKSEAYRNIFDPDFGWFRPRKEDGSWAPLPENARTVEGYGCIESDPYQQGWFVPHDIDGLIGLLGGKEATLKDLENFFDNTPEDFHWNAYYNHANEPVHLVPFMFNKLGAPELTQKWTRKICDKAYFDAVEGLVGNEDVGQMSAWYVLAASGIHPACPGDPAMEITSPVFDKITFKLDGRYAKGRNFTVIAHDNSSENIYIQKACLNGKELEESHFDFSEIYNGGTLELWMGDKPGNNWK